MKITNYFASSTPSQIAQYLQDWNVFSQINNNTWNTTGQNVDQVSSLVVPAGVATVSISTAGALTVGGAGGGFAQAMPAQSVIQVNGVQYAITSAVAAGAAAATVNPAPAVAVASAVDSNCFYIVRQGLQYVTRQYVNTLTDVTIVAHGINIYDSFPTKFYNAYTSYHYGGPNINTPYDTGLVFIPFGLYPGTYQPSGHINVSRAREFYLNYDSAVINSGNPGTLVVIASAINFLLISDGSA